MGNCGSIVSQNYVVFCHRIKCKIFFSSFAEWKVAITRENLLKWSFQKSPSLSQVDNFCLAVVQNYGKFISKFIFQDLLQRIFSKLCSMIGHNIQEKLFNWNFQKNSLLGQHFWPSFGPASCKLISQNLL